MPKETMTPKERWLAILRREKPDRVPMDYWSTGEARDKLMKHLGVSDEKALYERLHIDRVVGVGPHYVGPKLPPGENEFGIRHRDIDYGTGTYSEGISCPLAKYSSVREIEANYCWPSVDWYDYGNIPADIEGYEEYPIRGGDSEPFLTYKSLRGQEQAFMDLVLNPEIVHHCLDKLFELAYYHTMRTYEAIPGKVMFSYVAEDMGSQEALMFSPAQIREFLLPWMTRMIRLAHDAGVYVFHHSDGAVRAIIADMIAAGIDVLNPIQWRCKGMEREGLKRDFGDKLIFHGGVDNQYTLPFGTVAEVRQEVQDNLRILGAGGGYILAPCHNIQAVGPAENVVAMYDAGYEFGVELSHGAQGRARAEKKARSQGGGDMPKESMTSRERWLAVLQRQKPDRVPMDIWYTNEALDKLKRYLGISDDKTLYERLHIDRRVTASPRYVGPPIPPLETVYGVRNQPVDYGTGVYDEPTYHPLAQYKTVTEIEANYRWPSPDWYDYSHIADEIAGCEDYLVDGGGGGDPLLVYKDLRGQELAYSDLYLNPDMVHYCLDKQFELSYQNSLRTYEAAHGKVMLTWVSEDLGTQEGLLVSPAHVREFLLPGMKRLIDLAHEAGAYVAHHSDGAVRRILPEMIAVGIDVLNPIQWRCRGMEREGLKRDFGDKLVFHGGVDNQYTLPFGTVAEVRQEVQDNLRVLGAGGGYVLAPCHNIQAVGPAENVVAMYEAGYEHGWY